MSDFDKNKSDKWSLDREDAPENEGELSENELNKVSGGKTNIGSGSKRFDPNDKMIADKASRNSSDNFSDFNSSDKAMR